MLFPVGPVNYLIYIRDGAVGKLERKEDAKYVLKVKSRFVLNQGYDLFFSVIRITKASLITQTKSVNMDDLINSN
jgi:hypothetical protein